MSNISLPTAGLPPARRRLVDLLAEAFGPLQAQKSANGSWCATFERNNGGADIVLALRLNRLDPAKLEQSVRELNGMLTYCHANALPPRYLVVAHAGGNTAHADRLDLAVIEGLVASGRANAVVWPHSDRISRSTACATAHLTALRRAGAQLHLWCWRRRVDFDADGLALRMLSMTDECEAASVRRRLVAGLQHHQRNGQA